MRVVFILGLALLLAPAIAAHPDDSVTLTIALIRGERSKDSHSTSHKIDISGAQATYDVDYTGRRGPNQKPVHRAITLTQDDLKDLQKVIAQHRWYPSEHRDFIRAGAMNYFSITVTTVIGGKSYRCDLGGTPNNPVIDGDEKYEYFRSLLTEVFRILHDHDPEIEYVSVVN
jgi:hypothetical protein